MSETTLVKRRENQLAGWIKKAGKSEKRLLNRFPYIINNILAIFVLEENETVDDLIKDYIQAIANARKRTKIPLPSFFPKKEIIDLSTKGKTIEVRGTTYSKPLLRQFRRSKNIPIISFGPNLPILMKSRKGIWIMATYLLTI